MKNQYFGDVNDYRKYGLLRALQASSDCRLLVAWMLTPDDGGSDGGRRAYLEQPERWRRYDPELYDGLTALVGSGSAPQVSLIEGTGLLPRSTFHSEIVPDGRSERRLWREGLEEAAAGMDLVFLDPDNGVEVASKPVGHKGSSKYVTWQEIEELWDAGCSVLVYQHFPREPRGAFCARMISELRRRTQPGAMWGFRTPHVLFLLGAQPRHVEALRQAVSEHLLRWKGQIGVLAPPGAAARRQTPPPEREDRARPSFTERQGQYLAFIYAYTKIHGRPPAEADLQRYFRVSPPSVHQMILTLERRGLISRTPGVPRSVRLLVEPNELPVLL